MFGITDLATFILGTIVIILLPGPNSLYVMTVASRRGIAAGYRCACGIFIGDAILMLLATTGVASLLHTQTWIFLFLKSAGAAYLAWLGVLLLRSAFSRWHSSTEQAAASAQDDARPFRTALLISLLNPKAILFFVSFFIQFVDPAYAYPALSFLLLGLIVQCCSIAYLSMLIFSGARLAEQFRQRRRLAAAATGSIGGLFIGFGMKLATAALV